MASDGAFQCGSAGTRFLQITDGLSNTILVGEKHVALRQFGVGWCDCSTYDGDNYVCSSRAGGPDYPIAQTLDDPGWKFGSYHTSICQFGFCDGSVHSVPSSLSPDILGLLCNINDGEPIPNY